MKRITRLSDLSADELRRVQTTLYERYCDHSNVIDVAFGVAERRGKLDPSRSDAACFYVQQKPREERVAREAYIPDPVEARLKRGKKYVLVTLPRDVVRLGKRGGQPTGRKLFHKSRPTRLATTGCLFAWRVGAIRTLLWGVVTVGHLFRSVDQGATAPSDVRLRLPNDPPLKGRLLAYSRPRDGSRVDAAIVQMSRQDLIDFGLMPGEGSTRGRVIRAAEDLMNDQGKDGITIPESSAIPFRVVRVLPVSRSVPALGLLSNVIEVASTTARAFERGTSGSLWQITDQAAATQHAGLPSAFTRGWGQSLDTIAQWIKGRLARVHRVSEADIDLRLIRAI